MRSCKDSLAPRLQMQTRERNTSSGARTSVKGPPRHWRPPQALRRLIHNNTHTHNAPGNQAGSPGRRRSDAQWRPRPRSPSWTFESSATTRLVAERTRGAVRKTRGPGRFLVRRAGLLTGCCCCCELKTGFSGAASTSCLVARCAPSCCSRGVGELLLRSIAAEGVCFQVWMHACRLGCAITWMQQSM